MNATQYTLTITELNTMETTTYVATSGTCLLDAIRQVLPTISFPCGGHHTCGKCRIRLVNGSLPVTDTDKAHLTEAELKAGYRLACSAYPTDSLHIELISSSSMKITSSSTLLAKQHSIVNQCPVIGIDIGTTTIVMQAANSDNNGIHILASLSFLNPQIPYGADVLSRITYGKPELTQCLLRTLDEKLTILLRKAKITSNTTIAIAGNTTMLHLLQGFPVKSLGAYPFSPYNSDSRELSWAELNPNTSIPNSAELRVKILPCKSAFLGADLLCGIETTQLAKSSTSALLIDLGTNGEMALWNGNSLYATSVAAGPALEGACLSHGTGSVSGAIYKVALHTSKPKIRTIDNHLPIGICGTGAISCLSELLKHQQMDSTGLLVEPLRENGAELGKQTNGSPILLTQEDIRQLQLALASIRAGYKTLLTKADITEDSLNTIYLAGGLGTYLDLNSAIRIGLFPEQWHTRINCVGNTALSGALLCALNQVSLSTYESMCDKIQLIELASDPHYRTLLLDEMSFPDEPIGNICK